MKMNEHEQRNCNPIRVLVRLRQDDVIDTIASVKGNKGPSSPRSSNTELPSGSHGSLIVKNDQIIQLHKGHVYATAPVEYQFDKIYSTESKQSDIFDENIADAVHDAVLGNNVTIMVTGATQSGKSYTLFGPRYNPLPRHHLQQHQQQRNMKKGTAASQEECDGIAPRALRAVYSSVHELVTKTQRNTVDYYLELSFVELYNNSFRDLLDDYRRKINQAGSASAVSLLSQSGESARGVEAGSPINVRRSMIRLGSTDVEEGGFSNISLAAPSQASNEGAVGMRRSSHQHGGSSTSSSPHHNSSSGGGSGHRMSVPTISKTKDPHLIKDVIDVHESEQFGVFLSRPGGSIRCSASTVEEALAMVHAGCRARTVHEVERGGHLSSRGHAILTLYIERRIMRRLHNKKRSSNNILLGTPFENEISNNLRSGIDGEGGNDLSTLPGAVVVSCDDVEDEDETSKDSPPKQIDSNWECTELYVGKLHMVDLAGIDRLGLSGATGEALKETQYINSSLNALGEVLRTLSSHAIGTSTVRPSIASHEDTYQIQRSAHLHVPYLDSKLTHLLKDSLGGNCKTILIATLHTAEKYLSLSTSTLKYAAWAKNVKAQPLKPIRFDLSIPELKDRDEESKKLRKILLQRTVKLEQERAKKLKQIEEMLEAMRLAEIERQNAIEAAAEEERRVAEQKAREEIEEARAKIERQKQIEAAIEEKNKKEEHKNVTAVTSVSVDLTLPIEDIPLQTVTTDSPETVESYIAPDIESLHVREGTHSRFFDKDYQRGGKLYFEIDTVEDEEGDDTRFLLRNNAGDRMTNAMVIDSLIHCVEAAQSHICCCFKCNFQQIGSWCMNCLYPSDRRSGSE